MRDDEDRLLTAAEVETVTTIPETGKPAISRHLVYMWRAAGLLEPRGMRGRSPLYRWSDVVTVDARMARRAIYANNHRARRAA
jgi:hypothetical protein